MDVDVAGTKPRKVLLKAMQHHQVKGNVTHIEFYEVSMTRKLRVSIPLLSRCETRYSADPDAPLGSQRDRDGG